MNSWYLSPILEHFAGPYGVVVLLALLLLGAWVVSVMFTRISPARRLAIGLLRLIVVVLLIAAMLRPTLVFTDIRPQPAAVVVLIDGSRSMSVKDAFGGRTRWEALKTALAESQPALKKLLAVPSYELKVYVFDAEAKELQLDGQRIALDSVPRGDLSAYGTAMQEVLRREHHKRLLAFVLMGDGALNTAGVTSVLPQASARSIAQQGAPLIVVPFGQRVGSEQPPDVEIETMPDDIRVFVKNELTISGTVRVWGFVNRDIPLQLLMEKPGGKPEVVAATVVQARRDGDQLRYEMRYTPSEPGEYRATVRAAPQAGEKATDNNELSTYVTVLPGGLKVLYLEGEPRPEQRFLRRALGASPDIQVTLKWIRPTNRGQWPLKTIDGISVADYFTRGKYDVYILGDLDADVFLKEDWAKLKQTVNAGAGLLMLGGWNTFWPGGYQHTPLADIIPIEYDDRFDKSVKHKLGHKGDEDYRLSGPQRMHPADPLGSRHYVMQLAPGAANAAAWRALPPLNGGSRFRGVPQGALVLAENDAGQPLLAAAEPGGRVLAFAGDSTWLWAMHGQAEAHRRFWRQAILWLARKDEAMRSDVWISLDSRRFIAGSRIRFTAGARSAEGSVLSNVKVTLALVLPDGKKRSLTPRQRGEEVEAEITERLPPGQYTIEATATEAGRALGTARARFLVYDKDLEMANSMADPALLESLAEVTKEQGGHSVVPEELPKLFDELAAKPVKTDTQVRVRETLYDRWYVFATVVGAMCLEWFLRKRWRLV